MTSAAYSRIFSGVWPYPGRETTRTVVAPTCRSIVRNLSEQTSAKSRDGLASIVTSCRPGSPVAARAMTRPDEATTCDSGRSNRTA